MADCISGSDKTHHWCFYRKEQEIVGIGIPLPAPERGGFTSSGAENEWQSRAPVDLGPPPSHADKQETPVLKKLWRLTFERMAHKLE